MAFKDRPYFRRLQEVDDLLRRRRPVTTAVLAARWETSTKTVQRFLNQMRTDFDAPIGFDRARKSFVYTNPEYRLPWLPVEGKDLFAIGVAMKVLQLYEGTPAADDLRQVYKRLSEFMPPEIRVRPSSLMERLYIHPQPIRLVDPRVWQVAADALREKTALEIDYRKPGREPERRTVEPYCMLLAGSDWLLAARDPEDGVVKTFYVNRIVTAKETKSRFAIPRDFDAARHFGESIGIWVGNEHFRFRVRLDKEVAAWSEEVRWHPKQKVTRGPDGSIDLELPAGSLWEARRFVLSFGRHAKALSPPELVADLKGEADAMRETYTR
ncbi:MAG TPA: WYL domain-containing protein [Thermoanaerobaculia bacterium]|nr:WYL domain-containing protein [Thermoanaerobaculia bacterium]HQR66111.1 WYL domain-containing protein [Thermoanaerobaculia bacterium]